MAMPPTVQNGGALEKVAMTNRDPADVVSVNEVERILILSYRRALRVSLASVHHWNAKPLSGTA